ncbi:MAG: phosphoadenylyl-sulfate reductase [Comamonadaceae bacterium]|nr:phosphoadenylyl-sulfate reductase [Comamonadaceae bacterium]
MSAIDLNARPSSNFAAKLKETAELLEKAAQDYAAPYASAAPRITLACSLGAEDMVLVHLIHDLQLDIGIFVLETGQLHPETLALLERLKTRSRTPIEVLTPVPASVVQFVTKNGKDAMYQSITLRKACCDIRKMEPLSRALNGKDAWITGLRREQSGARADVPLIDRSDPRRVKFNPLSHWTWGDVWHFIAMQKIDYNPLHDQFYPSIGCAPCTRAVSAGEDFRAGRWWWEDEAAKECGLHVGQSSNVLPSGLSQIQDPQEKALA